MNSKMDNITEIQTGFVSFQNPLEGFLYCHQKIGKEGKRIQIVTKDFITFKIKRIIPERNKEITYITHRNKIIEQLRKAKEDIFIMDILEGLEYLSRRQPFVLNILNLEELKTLNRIDKYEKWLIDSDNQPILAISTATHPDLLSNNPPAINPHIRSTHYINMMNVIRNHRKHLKTITLKRDEHNPTTTKIIKNTENIECNFSFPLNLIGENMKRWIEIVIEEQIETIKEIQKKLNKTNEEELKYWYGKQIVELAKEETLENLEVNTNKLLPMFHTERKQ